MALDDFADHDEEALGGLDDLFADSVPVSAPTATEPVEDDAPQAGEGELEEPHFLDEAAIDEELLSSVEDVLSELDDLEQDDEHMFGLHSELGIPKRRPKPGDDEASAFPDILPVEAAEDGAAGAYESGGYVEHVSVRRGWLPTVAILAANLALLLFAWNASSSLQSGLRDVRAELEDVRSTAIVPETTGTPSAAGVREQRPAEPDPAQAVPTFDRVALEIAQREVERGLYTSARRRLYALLALADRIEPERRAEVEALATYRIADSYRIEARARREVAQ